MQSHEHRRQVRVKNGRDGIALVVVLGFLSLLIIMAVGFAISMRVERLSARNSVDLVKVRQLGEAALARTVSDIEDDLGDQLIPDWRGTWVGGAFESVGSGVACSNLLTGETTNHIPRSLWQGAKAAEANAQWINLDYINDAGQTVRIGRYAYIVLDCSGLFDVNFDYSTTNQYPMTRGIGRAPYEFQLNNALLGEVMNANWTKMITCRTDIGQNIEKPWFRLETVSELEPFLCQGYANAPPLREGITPSNFFVYSRFPQGYLDPVANEAQQAFYVGTTNFDVVAAQAALSAMPGSGSIDIPNFILNLKDYMDEDYQPGNRSSFCTEMVPMVNEVVISNRFVQDSLSSGFYTNEYRVLVELWFPFGLANNRSYNCRIASVYDGADPPQANPTPPINETFTLPSPIQPRSFLVVTSSLRRASVNALPDLNDARVRVAVWVNETTDGAKEVDIMGTSGSTIMPVPIGQSVVGFGSYMRGVSANDPRINWNGQDSTQWRDNTPITLGTTNHSLALTWNSQFADGDGTMYVRNSLMQVPGEMGLMLYNASRPWRTIDLVEGAGDFYPVLDRFTTRTNEVVYGLINPNGWNTGVVATAFMNMPVDKFPGESGAPNMTAAQAITLARSICSGSRTITNISELGASTISNAIRAAIGGTPGIHQIEGAIRNSANLLSPRHNAFTVILAAQLTDAENNPLAETRGVGIIWRDPYTVADRHQVYVRNFRWITE